MTELYFIRHGESQGNRRRLFIGHTDLDLTEKGYAQAELAAEYLQTIPADAIYSSDLIRAYNTAKVTADKLGLEIIKSPELREIYGGAWEGARFDSLIRTHKKEYTVWIESIGEAVCPGGESISRMQSRFTKEVERIARENDGKTILIFTHATPIRCIKAAWDNIPPELIKDIPWVTNASVTRAVFDGACFRITDYGYDGFMGDLVTGLPVNI